MPRWDDAACRDAGNLWNDIDGERRIDHEYRQMLAKAICRACPRRDECRQWALDNQEPQGVWGGMTEAERKHALGLSRNSRLQGPQTEHGTNSGYVQHLQRKTVPCGACRYAHATYQKGYREGDAA